MNLILFGFKSCGKTTLGKLLAQRLNRPFIDTDRLIEHLYFQRTGQSLTFREIFKTAGAAVFRTLESDVLQPLKSAKTAIIAVGGGLVLDPTHVTFLAKLGQLVYLNVSKETLKRRVLGGELPAYLDPLDPEGSFEQMYKERQPKYEAISALSVDLEKKTQDEILQELSALIHSLEQPHGK